MSSDLDPAAIGRLLDEIGLAGSDAVFVAKGSTCAVWRADTVDGPVAVRVAAPRPGRFCNLEADVAIRRRLPEGVPVARPIADHRDHPCLIAAPHRPAWVVDRWVEGEPADTSTSDPVWRDLGVVLAALHALPSAGGYGRVTVAGSSLRGRRHDATSGIADRFEQPWPFTDRSLGEHPVAEVAPELVGRLERLRSAIRAAADAPPAIVHADLNGPNIRHAAGRLSGLIDFADAAALASVWDFASLRYFHGEGATQGALAGYTPDTAQAAALARDACLLAPVIALHQVSRAQTLDLPPRRAKALGRLRRDLDAAEAG